MKKEKKVITPKTKEIIKNLSITISKESKKVNGRNIKLIEILQKKLDKIKPQAYLLLLILLDNFFNFIKSIINKKNENKNY